MLAASFVTTAQLYKNEKDAISRDLESQTNAQVLEIEHAILARIKAYEQLLMGVRGHFDASEYVDADEFSQYVDALKLQETHPEIRGISVSYYVPGDELEFHASSNSGKRKTDYAGRLEKGLAEYAPVAMIEPKTPENLRIIGFDNFSSLERKTVMERARDLDGAQMTRMLPLAQNGSSGPERGAIVFLPVYGKNGPRSLLQERRTNVV